MLCKEKLKEYLNFSFQLIKGTKRKARKLHFNFDKVFRPVSTQEMVFAEISQLVQSAIDGYNVCIFAYGQTGSGKTFTMEGDLSQRDQWGINPRALEQVFYTCESLQSKGWKVKMTENILLFRDNFVTTSIHSSLLFIFSTTWSCLS